MELKIGNPRTLQVPMKDADGVAITNLATATDIIFAIKKNQEDSDADAVIKKVKTDMTVDSPATGTVTIPLTSVDTNIPKGTYYIAVQVNYNSTTNQEEIELDHSTISMIQDTIRG